MEAFEDVLQQELIADPNHRLWNLLGVDVYNKEDVYNKLEITLEPHRFKHLLITAVQTRFKKTMFTKDPTFSAIFHLNPSNETGDFDPNSAQTRVSLTFFYKYLHQTQTGETISITPNHEDQVSLYSHDALFLCRRLEDRLPFSASVVVDPYIPADHQHHPGVDTYIYYRWTPDPDPIPDPDDLFTPMILRIRIEQQPIPPVPEDAPPPEAVPWKVLGSTRVVSDPTNEIWLWENYFEFYVSTPLQLKVRIIEPLGIRATNVYTTGKLLHGLQVKMKVSEDQSDELVHDRVKKERYIAINMGKDLIQFNPDFMNEVVKICYRWRSTALELKFELAADNHESSSDDQLLAGKRKLGVFLGHGHNIDENIFGT